MQWPYLIVIGIALFAPVVIGQPDPEVNRDQILNKFRLLEEECLKRRVKASQILCVMAMAPQEINNNIFFPIERIASLQNEKSSKLSNVPEAYGKDIHGEIRAIHLENTIMVAVDQVNKESRVLFGGVPYVFVYSYFIPCARIANVYYSCAEELVTYARINSHLFHMLVGYNIPFEHTDLKMAEGYLYQGGIYAIVNLESGKIEMSTDFEQKELKLDVLQDKLHECIVANELLCTCDECAKNKDIIVRAKIDSLVQLCTTMANLGNKRGPVTHLSMWLFHNCFKENGWLKLCSKDRPEENYAVGQCFIDITKTTYEDTSTVMMLGMPRDGPSKPYWDPANNYAQWGHLYTDYVHCDSQMIHNINSKREPFPNKRAEDSFERERFKLMQDKKKDEKIEKKAKP